MIIFGWYDIGDTQLNGKKVKQIINDNLKKLVIDELFKKINIKMSCTNKYFKVVEPAIDMSNLKKYRHLAYVNTNQPCCLLLLIKFNQKNV